MRNITGFSRTRCDDGQILMHFYRNIVLILRALVATILAVIDNRHHGIPLVLLCGQVFGFRIQRIYFIEFFKRSKSAFANNRIDKNQPNVKVVAILRE